MSNVALEQKLISDFNSLNSQNKGMLLLSACRFYFNVFRFSKYLLREKVDISRWTKQQLSSTFFVNILIHYLPAQVNSI